MDANRDTSKPAATDGLARPELANLRNWFVSTIAPLLKPEPTSPPPPRRHYLGLGDLPLRMAAVGLLFTFWWLPLGLHRLPLAGLRGKPWVFLVAALPLLAVSVLIEFDMLSLQTPLEALAANLLVGLAWVPYLALLWADLIDILVPSSIRLSARESGGGKGAQQ